MPTAFEIPKSNLTYLAGADLSSKQFYALKITAERTANLCTVAGEVGCGVLQDKPALAGRACNVMNAGITKAVAGAAIAAGAQVTTNAAGKFVTAAAGNVIWGVAETAAGADNDLFSLRLTPGNAKV